MSGRVLWFSLGIGFLVLLAVNGNNAASPDVRASVEQVLLDQQQAWNRHDLEGFRLDIGSLRN